MTDIVLDPVPLDQTRTLEDYATSSPWAGQDWFGMTRFLLAANRAQVAREGQIDPETGEQLRAPEPAIDPATLNQQYGITGQLTFNSALPESVAKDLYDAKREELFRQDAAERTRGFWANTARVGVDFVAGALDPVNVAASFVPVVGEARMAEMLGVAVAEGLGARLAARAATGAVQGAAGQAALEPLQIARANSLQEDYTARQALEDVAFGAVLGAGLHTATGTASDILGKLMGDSAAGKTAAADIDVRAAATRAAVAQLAEDRPVEVTPVLNAAAGQPVAADPRFREAVLDAGGRPQPDDAAAQAMAADAAKAPADDIGAQMADLENRARILGFAANGVPAQFREFRPDELGVDAASYQFKGNTDAQGLSDRLAGVRQWDEMKAGTVIAHEQPDGSLWIADGHQRLGLAKALAAAGQSPVLRGYLLREADGVTPAMASAIAAGKNIAEGTGTALDAAKVLRAAPWLKDTLPPSSELVRQGNALAGLGDQAFDMVANGAVPHAYGAVVGRLARDPREQAALIDLLAKTKPDNGGEAEATVRQGIAAGFTREKQFSLFGEDEIAHSLFTEKSKVMDRAMKTLRQDRALFARVAEQRDKLEAAGNSIAAAVNEGKADTDARSLEILSALAYRKGPVGDALNAAARSARKRGDIAASARDFVAAVRGAVERGDVDWTADGRDVGDARPGAASIGAAGGAPDSSERGSAEDRVAPTPDEIAAERETWKKEGGQVGPHGPIFDDVKGDWHAAVERLKTYQDGEVPAALHHPAVGDIDVVWGNRDKGLAHILREDRRADMVDRLPDVLTDMTVLSRSKNRVRLETPDHMAIVRLDWDGNEKTWLLSAFEKNGRGAPELTDDGQASSLGRADTAPPTRGETNIGASEDAGNHEGELRRAMQGEPSLFERPATLTPDLFGAEPPAPRETLAKGEPGGARRAPAEGGGEGPGEGGPAVWETDVPDDLKAEPEIAEADRQAQAAEDAAGAWQRLASCGALK